jgi:DNA-binding CsgD family transcriptional regulator
LKRLAADAHYLSADESPCPLDVLAMVTNGSDPMWSLVAAAGLVRDTLAGVGLRRDGGTEPLPGLSADPLLVADSPALAAARRRIGEGTIHSSYLWPLGGRHAPGGHIRITALARTKEAPADLTGLALTSRSGNLHGLTPRELEILGMLVEGCSNCEMSRILRIARRTAAAHVEHILRKLSAPTRTSAAVRADRAGLYVPAPLWTAG